jgi:hypothetical protein
MNKTIVYLFQSSLKQAVFFDPSKPSFFRAIFDPNVLRNIWGSVLLRQLIHAKIMDKFAPEGWRQICTNEIGWENSIIILHKSMFTDLRLRQRLKENGNVILLDVIDGVIDDVLYADGILCCSHKAHSYYKKKYSKFPVFFVEQGVDPRVPKMQTLLPEFSAYYFGDIVNFQIFNSVFQYVRPCFTYANNTVYQDWLSYLPKANFHYAVRPPSGKNIFKPFIKGGIAAYCASNMLIHKDDGDAAYYLGNDYPYLIREDLSENTVLEYLRKAREEYGGAEWNRGLSIMADVKEQFAPQRIAGQFWDMIQSFV